ncbi:MAG: type III pantothenate kinase [Bacteroidales bacterium]|nr:type III pantothenate kinase [Bacteroidales bacterium]
MNLTIDIGNTRTKTGLFDGFVLVETDFFSVFNKRVLEKYLKKHKKVKNIIISSVKGDIEKEIILALEELSNFKIVKFNSNLNLPFVNKYETPSTLGSDRLAAVCGANYMFPCVNLLVINAGTCITYDFISSKKLYKGGAISPGITMRLKALNYYTGQLPLITSFNNYVLTGTNTETCILSGVLNGVIMEIEGFIREYNNKYKDLIVILSGGDYNFIKDKIKFRIFAVPNIVLIGLNIILNYNDKHIKRT